MSVELAAVRVLVCAALIMSVCALGALPCSPASAATLRLAGAVEEPEPTDPDAEPARPPLLPDRDELPLPDPFLDPSWPDVPKPEAMPEPRDQAPEEVPTSEKGQVTDEMVEEELRRLEEDFNEGHWDSDFKDPKGEPVEEWGDDEFNDPITW